jgi:RteC protein
MKPTYERLYAEMLIDLNRCKALDLPDEEKMESCYRVAGDHWKKLKEFCQQREFESPAEEIEFFREVKPLFTCHIEFYLVMYEEVSFVSSAQAGLQEHWEQQLKRYQRFYDRHEEFMRYYESGARFSDDLYFLRRSNIQPVLSYDKIYHDRDFCTSHDGIIRSLVANRMYHDYVRDRLGRLRRG